MGDRKMSKHEAYTVVYRTGGTDNCTWKRTINYLTIDEAKASAISIEKMGYKALVQKAHFTDTIGLPQGWSHK